MSKPLNKQIVCKDGAHISVQASRTHYSTPRSDVGPYTEYEVGYPSHPFGKLDEYYDGSVHAYVPKGIVEEYIAAHGGIACGALPQDPPSFALLARGISMGETASNFRGTDGAKVKRGDWLPTHFAYVDGVVRDGRYNQWLVVGDASTVSIGGREVRLEPVVCEVKGMECLEGPCVARKLHKVRSAEHQVQATPSNRPEFDLSLDERPITMRTHLGNMEVVE
jgi:hypothetical protein